MPSALVIVESPAKARTIEGYLGKDFIVESSIGHIRDLPKTAAEIPASYKGEPWARLGIDVDNDFKAIYVVDKDKRKHINSLKKLASSVDTVYLATDEDREGEAIAWHLLEELSPPTNVEVKRMVFHEITEAAILSAVDEPRDIDIRLVEAQEARRMLDRLYGFEVSPVLWKKIKPKLSAGRVQSVAVRIVVDRERERMQFVAAEYWSVEATLAATGSAGGVSTGQNAAGGSSPGSTFEAAVTELDGKRIATGKDFNDKGEQKSSANLILLDETSARQLSDSLQGQQAKVSDMTVKPYSRRPAPPFITSTLQQEASNRLRLSSADTMRAAQGLYEKGLITYMRTDSTTLSDDAIKSARAIIKSRFGNDYLPSSPRIWKNKVKNAQEAHEAIRPSGSNFRTPQEVAKMADTAREAQLYELIYKRTLACQMTDAIGETASVKLTAPAGEQVATLAASGTVITHPGWQAAYSDASGADDSARSGNKGSGTASSSNLPPMSKGDTLGIAAADANGHSTKPPARYTEATLVKRLEELGVGRPSTYATIMRTIMDRGYVSKNGSQLVPNFTAFSVVNLLATHFPDLVDYAFTARMEDDLDRIANGEQERVPWLRDFYFGNGDSSNGESNQAVGLKTLVSEHLDEIDPRKINEVLLGADENGEPVYVREGRFGPYVSRGQGENAERASVPEGTVPDELTVERAVELLSTPDEKVLGTHPDTGEDISVRSGRFGPYVQLGEGEKPKRSSLFATMTPETVTLEEAVALLSLPRVVGIGAEGEEVIVQNGRYGPFVKMGKETRSLESEEQLLTITLEECQAVLNQPKTRGGQSRQAKTLQEIGPHPETGDPIVLKDGRYGPYVTDGKTNASLRKSDTPEDITIDRALELIKLRQESKAQKRSSQRSPRKRTAKK